ncbi:TetR/AcrR family transcriptional regulator [Streptomyces sp. B1866]|uniref:TetR/AcrR family transcriptional regulator n=1 Tax=Streptomyces sp. B1866 TaxID=3075431 RepID=UPI0028928026|nr:TetR/AcrR family transcriptional regulator [Streptomyces sp. B1866]MDT3396471.1 TetR/AcrR family transcriptional regulator [Streptomyces sp. B1866]
MAAGTRFVRPRDSVWLSERPTPRRRSGQQPAGLDLEKILAATVRLLDAEGLARFSMRRLAAELGVTAMSVYWYVDTKDDLLELALDCVMGEIALPGEGAAPAAGRAGARPAAPDAAGTSPGTGRADWRDRLRRLAREYRHTLVRHPWVSPLSGAYLNIGPKAMAFANAAQRVMAESGLPREKLPSALSLVYQFVYGFATIEGRFAARCREAGVTQDEYFGEVMGSIADRPEFDEPRQILEARGGATVEEMRERDFALALDFAIAGIEALRDGPEGAL